MSNYTFENLTHSGLFRINSKDDKNVSLGLDVFGGHTSFVIFTGAGGKPFKLGLPRKFIAVMKIILKKMRDNCNPDRQVIAYQAFDENTKKYNQVGQIAFGIDENFVFQFDISHRDLNGRHIFPVKQDSRFDLKSTNLTEREITQASIDFILEALELSSPFAERLSSFKRPAGGGGKGGWNQGGNRAGGGGYQQNRQQNNNNNGPTFSDNDSQGGGSSENNSDLYV